MVSRPFAIRDLLLGVFDSRREMGQPTPLQCIRASISQLMGCYLLKIAIGRIKSRSMKRN